MSEQGMFDRILDGDQGMQNDLQVQGVLDASRPQTVLRMHDGRSVSVATDWLLSGMTATSGQVPPQAGATVEDIAAERREQMIPLVSEEMLVGKKTVVTGAVRLHRGTESFTDTVGLDLTRIGWEVERIQVGQIVAERPEIRTEGELTIFPLVEERLVARREYFLLEEVHVRRVATTSERSTTLELKRDLLTVERDGLTPPEAGV